MFASGEAGDVFALLEGGGAPARDAADALLALYGVVREPWLTRALLLYHARTGSVRALDLLARAPDSHARHLLDALFDQLRAERPARKHALAALAPLVARRPPWLHRLPQHPLARDLLRAAARENETLPLLHALLALAALLPAAPALAAPHAADLAEALLRPAALDPPPSPAARAHLQLAQRALFHALYATHPCTLLDALRADLQAAPPAARDEWERRAAPLLASVRLHPALVTGSRQQEADAARARWARLEPHDVVAECRRLSLPPAAEPDATPPTGASDAASPSAPMADAPAGSGAYAARTAAALRPGAEPWFALSERCGADSAPHTPLPAEPSPAEPPEAAVEATPENTPARETRAAFRFPAESSTVRALGRASGASPGGEAVAARLARVASERRALHSPVPLGGAPPAGAQRPEPARPATAAAPASAPPDGDDREVRELTRAGAAPSWPEAGEGAVPRWSDPRARRRAGAGPARGGRPARRAASCGPRLPPGRSASVAVQTVDAWPEPYEFLIADFYRGLPDEPMKKIDGDESDLAIRPCEQLDAYLSELYHGRAAAGSELGEQLALVHAQLMYERWRRDAHAERNRRLLGRCRQARALELQNAALQERVRAAQRERDELRARLARQSPPPPPAPQPELEAALTALAAERAARLRAEAALQEAEAARAADAAELHRARADAYEAARHVEALARAALAAERRAEHVRRLRRELLVLGEREARLAAAARAAAAAPPPDAGEARALRAALARAETEAEAAAARADQAAARALELEAALAARDAAVAELKRATRHAAEEGAARLRALQDKYAALLRVLRGAEVRKLELLAAAGAGAGAGAGAAGGCGRARRLLEEPEPLS